MISTAYDPATRRRIVTESMGPEPAGQKSHYSIHIKTPQLVNLEFFK